MDKVFSSSFYHNRYVDSYLELTLNIMMRDRTLHKPFLTNSCKREYLCTCLYLFG